MIETYLLTAVVLLLLGACGGVIVVLALASRRDGDITSPATGLLARGARTINQLHTRGPGVFHDVAYRHDLPRQPHQEW